MHRSFGLNSEPNGRGVASVSATPGFACLRDVMKHKKGIKWSLLLSFPRALKILHFEKEKKKWKKMEIAFPSLTSSEGNQRDSAILGGEQKKKKREKNPPLLPLPKKQTQSDDTGAF